MIRLPGYWKISLLLSLVIALGPTMAIAQSIEIGTGWDTPEIVYEEPVPDEWGHNALTIAGDRYGNLHLMWRMATRDPAAGVASVYSRWDGDQWTVPTDVLISPNGDRFDGATFAVDASGRLHAVWSGAVDFGLYYSWAWGDQAEDAKAWSTPVAIGPRSFSEMILTEGTETLHVIFTDSGRNVLLISSLDGGNTWSEPLTLSEFADDRSVTDPILAIDQEGLLHAVWSEGPLEGYPPLAVHYTQSRDGGITWQPPQQIFDAEIGEPNVARAGDGTLHIFGNGRVGVGGRYHRWSADGGETWSNVEEIVAPGTYDGLTGPISLAVDASGTLHVLYITGGGQDTGLMYTTWIGASLAQPQRLVAYGTNWFGEGAIIAVSEGNQLHLAVPSNDYNWIWHTRMELNGVPAIPPLPRPQQEVKPSPIPVEQVLAQEETSTSTPSLPSRLPGQYAMSSSSNAVNEAVSLAISTAVVMFVLGIVVVYHAGRRRGR